MIIDELRPRIKFYNQFSWHLISFVLLQSTTHRDFLLRHTLSSLQFVQPL
jgi:hypothetical protein